MAGEQGSSVCVTTGSRDQTNSLRVIRFQSNKREKREAVDLKACGIFFSPHISVLSQYGNSQYHPAQVEDSLWFHESCHDLLHRHTT